MVQQEYPSALLGDYQFHNKKTVLQTLDVLSENQFIEITEKHIKDGFLNVIKNTGLLGRWQELGKNPKIICDTAHNAHGLSIVLKQLEREKFEQMHIVLGVVNDKNLGEILPLFPKKAQYYFCKPNIPRGLEAEILKVEATKYGLNGSIYNSVSAAYSNATKNATHNDFIYVGGSTFVVAEIL